MVSRAPGYGIVQLPPIDGPAPKHFDIRKYKTAASTLMKSSRVSELKKLNRTLPACNLPVEVLQRIFIACSQSSYRTPTWSWVNMTFVCSFWREAALNCHELWSYIDFSHPKWTALCLYRSRLLPISIRAVVKADNQHSVRRTLHYAPMIRDIHLTSSIYDLGPLLGLLKDPNRYLESLVINVIQPDDNHDIRYSTRSVPSGGSPLLSLKYLELHKAPVHLLSPRFINLRHLSLHHLPPSEQLSILAFMSLLEGFPALRDLTLNHAFPKHTLAGNHNSRQVTNLPNLLTVCLTGSVLEMLNFLGCVNLQPAACLQCHIDEMGDVKSNFCKLAKVLGLHYGAIASEILLDTLVLTGHEESLRFTDEHTLNPDFRQTLRIRLFGAIEGLQPLLDLVIGPDPRFVQDEIIIGALKSIWDALPLADIEILTLQNLDVITQKSWTQLLPSLPSLRVLDIGGHAPSGLLWSLLLNARSHSHLEHDNMETMLLPALEDIYLHNVDCFTGGYMVSPSGLVNSHCDLDDSRFLDVILAYLEDRQQCCLSLRSLSLSRCSNTSMDVLRTIRGCVSHLLWDHRGMYEYKQGTVEGKFEESVIYRNHWPSKSPPQRHYFRLRTLLDLD